MSLNDLGLYVSLVRFVKMKQKKHESTLTSHPSPKPFLSKLDLPGCISPSLLFLRIPVACFDCVHPCEVVFLFKEHVLRSRVHIRSPVCWSNLLPLVENIHSRLWYQSRWFTHVVSLFAQFKVVHLTSMLSRCRWLPHCLVVAKA